MKRIKNFRLMLLGLLAMGSMNSFAAAPLKGDMVKCDNLVYVVTDATKNTVEFYGLNDGFDATKPNTDEKIIVPTTIEVRDNEGNKYSYKVTSVNKGLFDGSYGATAFDVDGDLTPDCFATLNATIKELTFSEGVRLGAGAVKAILTEAGYTQIEKLVIKEAKNIGTVYKTASMAGTIKYLDLTGITNDGDPIAMQKKFLQGAAKLETLILPKGDDLTIGENAFDGCTALKTVTFNGGNVVISDNAFIGAGSNVKNASGATVGTTYSFAKVKSIGATAFQNSGLTAVDIPADLEEVGSQAFDGSTLLKNVTIKSTKLTAVGGDWFTGCTAIENVTVNSATIATIAGGAFAATTNLQNVSLTGEKLKNVAVGAGGAFPTANGLLKTVDYENTIVEAAIDFGPTGTALTGAGGFPGHPGFNTYKFPATIKGALPSFAGCQKLATLSAVGGEVTELKSFAGCWSLATINLSGAAKLNKIASFADCRALTKIDFSATKVYEIPANCFQMTEKTAGKKDYQTKLATVTLPTVPGDKWLVVKNSAFLGCTKLEAIPTLNQARLSSIGTNAFEDSGLKGDFDLSAPNAKTGAGAYVFTAIPDEAFKNVKNMTSIKLAAGIAEIGKSAFNGCASLAEVQYTEIKNLATIGASAFQGCDLTEVDLSGAVGKDAADKFLFTKINTKTWADNANLATVILPAQIKSIGKGAFLNDVALESINLEETSITTLNNLFTPDNNTKETSLDNLKTLKLPETLTTIQPYALQFTGIEEIEIPSSVNAIPTDGGTGEGAQFQACTSLTTFTWVNVDPAITSLPKYFFRGDVSLETVKFLTTKTAAVVKDAEVFFMCNMDKLTVYLTPDSKAKTEAEGFGNENRQYSTLASEGNKVFKFNAKGLASDGYYYATYYNMDNSSWFKTSEFDVYSAVIQGNKVVLKPATAEGDYYKVARFNPGKTDKTALCIVRSKNIDAVPQLNSNTGSDKLSTLPSENELKWTGVDVKASKLKYQYKLGNKDDQVAFWRVTSGTIKAGVVYVEAVAPAPFLQIVVEGEGEVTGIENLFTETVEDDAPVYNMQGARVDGSLQKGVYIKNGKKFIVK